MTDVQARDFRICWNAFVRPLEPSAGILVPRCFFIVAQGVARDFRVPRLDDFEDMFGVSDLEYLLRLCDAL